MSAETWVQQQLAQAARDDRAELRAARRGEVWVRTEAQRLAAIVAAGAVPEECGDDIAAAPARGPLVAFDLEQAYPRGDGGVEYKVAGYKGRRSARCEDVFDRLEAQARRRKRPFGLSPAQVQMARAYRDLVEWYASAGVKCSSVEAVGGRGDGSFMDVLIAAGRRLELWRRRIGGVAMEVRRVRPGSGRRLITRRDLVDLVACGDRTIADVLVAHGWAASPAKVDGRQAKDLTVALAGSLDLMIGPVRSGVAVLRTDQPAGCSAMLAEKGG